MKTTRLDIDGSCWFECVEIEGFSPDISINYIEYAQDYHSANTEQNVDIDKLTAMKIVDFLKDKYDLV